MIFLANIEGVTNIADDSLISAMEHDQILSKLLEEFIIYKLAGGLTINNLEAKTSSAKIFVGKNFCPCKFSSAKIFVTCPKFRHFLRKF